MKIIEKIRLTIRNIKLVNSIDKYIILINIIILSISTVTPFVNTYFSKYLTQFLSNESTPIYLTIGLIFVFLLIISTIRILGSLLRSEIQKRNIKLHHDLNLTINSKCNKSTYMHILDKDFMDKKELAKTACNSGKHIALTNDMFNIIRNVIVICGMTYNLRMFPYIVFVALFVVIVGNVVTSIYTKKANYQMDVFESQYRIKTSYVRGVVNDSKYAKDIRAFGMEDGLSDKMKKYDIEARQQIKKHYNSLFKKNVLVEVSTFIFNCVVYFSIGYAFLIERTIQLSDFVFLIGVVVSVHSAFKGLTDNIISANSDLVYIKDYFNFIDLDSEINHIAIEISEEKIDIIKSIEFENVSFMYPGSNEWALKNFNFKFEIDNVYMVVGKNGAGKSTLIKLLLRLYDHYDGKILINGINLKNIDYSNYIKRISVVFQDYSMFSMPIKDNIVADGSEPNMLNINKLLESLSLTEKIESLQEKSDSLLFRQFDKKGVELSGGEMQKLAIARCLYKNSVISIFDEPTSSLDIYSEQNILEVINNTKKDRIIIFTTHRLSMKNIASRIIVLDDGQICEYGSHDDLLEKKGAYYELFTAQAEGFKSRDN